MPGVAICERLPERLPGVHGIFMGVAGSREEEIVGKTGFRFASLRPCAWPGYPGQSKLASLAMALGGVASARRTMKIHGVRVVIALGSYVSFAAILAGWLSGIPVVLFEPNALPGLTTRLGLPFARECWVSDLWEVDHGERKKFRRVGVPLRTKHSDRIPPRSSGENWPRFLVLAGSLGDAFVEEKIPPLLAKAASRFPGCLVRHLCGCEGNPTQVAAIYERARIPADVRQFSHDVDLLLQEADYVVTSAGAVTLHEIARAGRPALVVPNPRAADRHQDANARRYCKLVSGSDLGHPASWDAVKLTATIEARLLNPPEKSASFNREGVSQDVIFTVLKELTAHV